MNKNPRHQLLELMENLNKSEINCAQCTGVCCTDKANSMKIDEAETESIYQYLISHNIWDKDLENSLRETIDKYRLDQEISTGKNSVFRKTYTCPFFKFKSLGCALPAEVKPYGCLAFNPRTSGIKNGENCASDAELLKSVEQHDLKYTIPEALLRRHRKTQLEKHNLIISNSSNPYFNLALEDYLLRKIKHNKPTLLLWRNRPSIVWGKFQNPWLECHIQKAREKGLIFVRRQSGGGTVYHDLGNLNFSILSDNGYCNRVSNLDFIIDAFKETKLQLKRNERNDLVIEHHNKTYKVSGSAFKQIKNKGLHHGTLLIDTQLDNISGLLNPKKQGIESKSIRSVPSPCINLKEIDPDLNYDKAIEVISNHWNVRHGSKTLVVDEKNYSFENTEKYLSWDWIWAETPKFEFQGDKVWVKVMKGHVIEYKSSDGLEIENLIKRKIGIVNNDNFDELNFLF
jgi:lipoate-protein ligase A